MERQEDTKIIKEKIQSVASDILKKFPTEESIEKKPKEIAAFLQQIRNILKEGTQAFEWNDERLRAYAILNDSVYVSFQAAILLASKDEDESCTFKCKRERDECISDDCGDDTSYPCFCCVPCNLTWLACLADCIV